MSCEPKLLLADEPTTALDVTIQAQILDLIKRLRQELGMAIIMITHDLGVVAGIADRINVMYAGYIVETGTADEIFHNPRHPYTLGLLKSIPRMDEPRREKLVPIEGCRQISSTPRRAARSSPVARTPSSAASTRAADRRYSLALMRHHGVPEAVIVDNEGFWDFIERASDAYDTDVVLPDGATIRAGGRDLRVVARPGHSTTDALLVDERERIAFVGDHLLGGISSNTEVYPALEPDGTRPRARVEYLQSLRETAAMPLARLLTGHGDEVTAHADLVRERLGDHDRRCERIVEVLGGGEASAFEIATHLWSPRTVSEQPLLVVWEVLGHLDLLLDAGRVDEHLTQDGSTYGVASFALAATATTRPLGDDRPARPS